MRSYVVDTSVAVELVLKTRLGDEIDRLVRNFDLFAPELIDLEVLSALRNFVLRNEISNGAALSAIGELENMRIARTSYRWLPKLIWGYHRNVTIYDATYLATAKELNLEVLTADSKLSRAPGIDVVVHDLRDDRVLDRLKAL